MHLVRVVVGARIQRLTCLDELTGEENAMYKALDVAGSPDAPVLFLPSLSLSRFSTINVSLYVKFPIY